jgi:hypothetical protein
LHCMEVLHVFTQGVHDVQTATPSAPDIYFEKQTRCTLMSVWALQHLSLLGLNINCSSYSRQFICKLQFCFWPICSFLGGVRRLQMLFATLALTKTLGVILQHKTSYKGLYCHRYLACNCKVITWVSHLLF